MRRKIIILLCILTFSAGGTWYYFHSTSLATKYENWKKDTGRDQPRKKKVFKADVLQQIDTSDEFSLWVTGCAHLPSDLRQGRAPISEAIYQSEQGTNSFHWDLMLFLGDFCAHPDLPNDAIGSLAKEQLSAGKKHRREQIYCLMGNHDAYTASEDSLPNAWFRTWIDPFGENPNTSGVRSDQRPFPIEGTYERYSFEVGNILFLVMADRNDVDQPAGRGGDHRGHPAGMITEETFFWWRNMVENNQDKIIISCHHHMLKNTTIGSAAFSGVENGYHGHSSEHDFKGASYLYFLDEQPDTDPISDYIKEHPGCIDIWMGAHTHISPLDTLNGKTFICQQDSVTFINAAVLSHIKKGTPSSSRLITFSKTNSSAKLQVYLHDDMVAPQGFCKPLEVTIPLKTPFELN